MDVYQRRRLVALSAIAAIFIVFVLLIRSCGGDGTPATSTTAAGATGTSGATSQSKATYIEQADQICLAANKNVAGVDVTAPTADTDLGKIVSGQLQELQTLTPPDEGTSDLDDYLTALQKQAKAYKQKGLAVQRGDTAAAAEIDTTLDKAAGDATDAATAFGFQVCGDLSKVNNPGGGGSSTTDTSTGDTGGTVTPTTTTPTTVTPTPTPTPTPDTGTPPAPTDGGTGGTGSDSGGVSP